MDAVLSLLHPFCFPHLSRPPQLGYYIKSNYITTPQIVFFKHGCVNFVYILNVKSSYLLLPRNGETTPAAYDT